MKHTFLLPGQFYVGERTSVKTVLGSCVAVVLVDQKSKYFAVNHFLLPEPTSETQGGHGRYGTTAIDLIYSKLKQHVKSTSQLKAYVFGGSSIAAALSGDMSIGGRNIEIASRCLKNLGIKIVHTDVGGTHSRTLTFDGNTFEFKVTNGGDKENSTVTKIHFKPRKHIKVLIVDDSAVIRNLFSKAFENAGLNVVGMAADPYQARDMIAQMKPDVITLDIEMPRMNGVQFLEKVMQHTPIPTIMVSSLNMSGGAAQKALDLGAVDFVQKPSQSNPLEVRQLSESLVSKVEAAANMKVKANSQESSQISTISEVNSKKIEIIGIGGNTGSQNELLDVIRPMAGDVPPVVVSNSAVASMLPAFIDSLKSKTSLKLVTVTGKQNLNLGNIYFIPTGYQGIVRKSQLGYELMVSKAGTVVGHSPSIDPLFKSIARSAGDCAIGIVLSGFGSDGIEGITQMVNSNSTIITIDPIASKFPHLPQRVIDDGLSTEVVDQKQIGQRIEIWRSLKAA